MLKLRVITALVLVALLGVALWVGRVAFVAVIAVLFFAAVLEWGRLAGLRRSRRIAAAVVLVGALLLLEAVQRTPVGPVLTLICGGAAALWVTLIALLVRGSEAPAHFGAPAIAALGLALLPAAWFALLYLHRSGILMMLSVLVLIWVADISAYFVGRAFGKRKLAPAISPGKTWAGVFGAIGGALLVATVVFLLWPEAPLFTNVLFRNSLWLSWLLLVVVVAFSIVGDLFESLLKRRAGLKDSGALLPGHGGVLDRIDSLMPVLPLAVLLERMFR